MTRSYRRDCPLNHFPRYVHFPFHLITTTNQRFNFTSVNEKKDRKKSIQPITKVLNTLLIFICIYIYLCVRVYIQLVYKNEYENERHVMQSNMAVRDIRTPLIQLLYLKVEGVNMETSQSPLIPLNEDPVPRLPGLSRPDVPLDPTDLSDTTESEAEKNASKLSSSTLFSSLRRCFRSSFVSSLCSAFVINFYSFSLLLFQ